MIPEFVQKHYAFKKGCSYAESVELHKKLVLYFGEVQEKGVAVPSPEVDEVWHNFILHTSLYQEYCRSNFGKFIHHNPKLPENIDEILAQKSQQRPAVTAKAKCDNQCNGGAKCDNQCNGGNKCDNQCNGGSWCDNTTFAPDIAIIRKN